MRNQPTRPLVAVVEDDVPSREALGRLLRAQGFEPALFEPAEAYLTVSPSLRPACIIVDVGLPGLSGLDLQRQLTAAGTPPIIVTTGTCETTIREQAEQNGCAGFFWKPFDSAALLTAIASLAEQCPKGQ